MKCKNAEIKIKISFIVRPFNKKQKEITLNKEFDNFSQIKKLFADLKKEFNNVPNLHKRD